MLGIDVVLAAVIILTVWITNYLMPQKGIRVKDATKSLQHTSTVNTQLETAPQMNQTDTSAQTDWHKKFADKFTDHIVSTDTTYSSPDLSIQLTYHQYDTGKLDKSEAGKHLAYGTKTAYVLADVYIGDISCFQTAFAQDTYGVGNTEKLSDAEICVLNQDGTMDIYQPGQVDISLLKQKGAYQSWVFGPSLLDDNGKAKQDFLTWDYIRESHPRTAIGYFEPGHYCLLLVDGRQSSTRGMFLDEMAKVFEDIGCKKAYNLDGGHCSFMTFQGNVANHPYKPEHEVQDGIFITEATK